MKRLVFLALFSLITTFIRAQVIEKSYLQTDRTLYGTQDTLWFKGYVFDEKNLISDQSIALHVLLSDEEGNKIRDKKWPIFDGLVEGSFLTPSREGKYYLTAFSGQMTGTNQFFKKEIYVRSEIADEISIDVIDTKRLTNENSLSIDLKVNLSSREVADKIKLNYSIWSDSLEITNETIRTDTAGFVNLSFNALDLKNTNYEVIVNAADKELEKPVTLAIPIPKSETLVDLQLLPEGGNLVADIKNKVAFKAIDQQGIPFDFKAQLIDEDNKVITEFSSFYKGMGHFDLAPEKGKTYKVKIVSPNTITQDYHLPESIDQGVVLTTRRSGNSNQIFLELKSTDGLIGSELKLVVSQQQGIIFEQELVARSREFINVPSQNASPGIARASILDKAGNILSERLLFIKADQRLKVELSTDQTSYKPREKVEIILKVTDMKGNPVSGGFNLAAIDQTRQASLGKDNPGMLAQILLNSELRGEIPTPNFYFSENPKAKQALEYVLLTNGWRQYKSSPFFNPEGLNGNLIQRNRKKKVIANTALRLYSIDGLVENKITVDDQGGFVIPSGLLKAKGDSFLLATSIKDKQFSPNIKLIDSTKVFNNAYKNRLIDGLVASVTKPDLKIYRTPNKVAMDKFHDVTVLNSFTLIERNFFGNACDALALDTEGNWVTKTAEQLDLSKLDLITLLRQVSDHVIGYGDIKTKRVKFDPSHPAFRTLQPMNNGITGFLSDAIATGAIMSDFTERMVNRIKVRNIRSSRYGSTIIEWGVPFDVYLNCEYVEPNANRENRFPFKFYAYEDFETIDLRNLESLSVNAPSTAGSTGDFFTNYPNFFRNTSSKVPRPIIVIKTKGGEIIRKPRLYPYYFYTTYETEKTSFYKPLYETEEQKDSPIYDLRNTIHWETDIITDQNGEATVSFYNADRPNTIRVTVEGIDTFSRIGFSQIDYQVNNTRGN